MALNTLFCQLHHALYGLKQSPCAWYSRMDYALLQTRLIKSRAGSNLYYHWTINLIIILILYVDDLFITRNDKQGIAQLKSQLIAQFCMTNLGLGVKFKCTTHSLLLHQTSYAYNLLNEFHMVDSTPAHVPIYESTCLQHDTGTKPINTTLYWEMVGKFHYLNKT